MHTSAPPPKLPMWYRVFAVIVGVLSLTVALVVLVEPVLALWLLILLLALGLFLMGMDRLLVGITGQPMVHVLPVLAMKEGPEAGSTQGSPPAKP